MTAPSELPPGYPQEWEADVVLADGMVAHVRPIVPDDTEAIHEFHANQSEESIYLRFFAPIKRLSDRDVHRVTHVDLQWWANDDCRLLHRWPLEEREEVRR